MPRVLTPTLPACFEEGINEALSETKSRKPAGPAQQGQLRLELVDVYGTRLNQNVDILLRHQQLSDRRIVRGIRSSSRILIRDLHGAPQGIYRLKSIRQPISLSLSS